MRGPPIKKSRLATRKFLPPFFANLLATGCECKPDEITQNDLTYLRALYRIETANTLLFQRNDIAGRMKAALESANH